MEADKKIKKWVKQIKKTADKQAANALVKSYYREMLGYVVNRCRNKEVAMEITQEIFVSMLQSIDNFNESKASFRTWLYRIAQRRIADYYRSGEYRNGLQNNDEISLGAKELGNSSAWHAVEIQEINDFIDSLEPDSRKIFRLKVFEDCTLSKIAQIMHLPESTVKTKFYATQNLIRREFKSHD